MKIADTMVLQQRLGVPPKLLATLALVVVKSLLLFGHWESVLLS